jgi:hypothetical protein
MAPLVMEHCQTCHQDEQLAEDISLVDYASAAPWATFMAEEVEHQRMPPFHAEETSRCAPQFDWLADPRLSQEAIDVFQLWSDAGAPEGDAAKASPLPTPEAFGLEEWDLELVPEEVFEVYEGDYQICFPMVNPLKERRWVEAVEVLPGASSLVHHVAVRLDTEGRSLERAGEEGWYPCTGTLDGDEIGGFLPGTPPSTYPEGAAFVLEPGAVLSMQVHYHVLSGQMGEDLSRVRLKLTETSPRYEPTLLRVGNDIWLDPKGGIVPGPDGETDFFIPSGASNHREVFVKRFTLPGTWAIFVVANHMHYVGVDALLTIEREGESSECLLHTPQWDFDWQQGYRIDTTSPGVPLVEEGDRLRLECAYNNSLTNARWMETLDQEGITEIPDVQLGDSALDEMCSAMVGLIDVTGDAAWTER